MSSAPVLPRFLSVIIVDGYPDAAESLAMLLNIRGFDARAAQSVGEALAIAASYPPDVVILEPQMPGVAWELARQIGLDWIVNRPLMVAITTDATLAGRRAAKAAGMDHYFVKPMDPVVVVGILRRFQRTSENRLAIAALRRDCAAARTPVNA